MNDLNISQSAGGTKIVLRNKSGTLGAGLFLFFTAMNLVIIAEIFAYFYRTPVGEWHVVSWAFLLITVGMLAFLIRMVLWFAFGREIIKIRPGFMGIVRDFRLFQEPEKRVAFDRLECAYGDTFSPAFSSDNTNFHHVVLKTDRETISLNVTLNDQDATAFAKLINGKWAA